jgi:hypothetical protein
MFQLIFNFEITVKNIPNKDIGNLFFRIFLLYKSIFEKLE